MKVGVSAMQIVYTCIVAVVIYALFDLYSEVGIGICSVLFSSNFLTFI